MIPSFISLLSTLPMIITAASRSSAAGLQRDLTLDEMGILVPNDPHTPQREYVLSNRDTIHWTADTNKSESRKWHGLVQKGWNLISNVWLDLPSSQNSTDNVMFTSPRDLRWTRVFPHQVIYGFDSYNETLFIPEMEDAFVVTYTMNHSQSTNQPHVHDTNTTLESVYFRPVFAFRKDWTSVGTAVELIPTSDNHTLFVKGSSPSYKGNYSYMGFYSSSFHGQVKHHPRFVNRIYPRDVYRHDVGPESERFVYEFGSMKLDLADQTQPIQVLCVAGSSLQDVQSKVQRLSGLLDSNKTIETKLKTRLTHVINQVILETDSNSRDRLSIAWSLASLDALTMHVQGQGIYAGLPWFNNYWGRDTFISLPGAFLKSGQYSTAKQILLNMGQQQNRNKSSPTYGRIPNFIPDPGLVPRQENSYETAGGTAWWVRAVWMLLEHEGKDLNFVQKVWPMVQIALEGELSRTDSNGFLTHENRGTWMDALYQGKTITPRGNRAIEIQTLFFTELDVASRFAKWMNDTKLETLYVNAMKKLKSNFLKHFFSGYSSSMNATSATSGYFYDHLNPNDTPNLQHRPNVMFLLAIPLSYNPLVPTEMSTLILQDVLKSGLIAPHGVRTLSPMDKEYRSTHDETGENHDYSYHNGDVWPFLTGPAVKAAMIAALTSSTNMTATGSDQKQLYKNLARDLLLASQIRSLDMDTVGAIEEVADGGSEVWTWSPNKTEKEREEQQHQLVSKSLSRACLSQTWSMAEYVRGMVETGMGLYLQMTRGRILLAHAPVLKGDSFQLELPVGAGGEFTNDDDSANHQQNRLSVSWKRLVLSGDETQRDTFLITMKLFVHGKKGIVANADASSNSNLSWTIAISHARLLDPSSVSHSSFVSEKTSEDDVQVSWDVESSSPVWQGVVQFL